jgi:hypothetical protein
VTDESHDDDEWTPHYTTTERASLEGVAHWLMRDLAAWLRGEEPEERIPGTLVPAAFEHRYDRDFKENLYLTAASVSERLVRDPAWFAPRSVAEEMVAYFMLEAAMEVYEESQDEKSETLDTLIEVAFEDHDFRMLFDRRFDGIEGDAALGAHMGFANLGFSEWFEPFREEQPVHPATRLPANKPS